MSDRYPHGQLATDPGARSLEELEARFRRECALLGIPPEKPWLEPRADRHLGPILDVAIIGAGMAGMATAMALKRLGITRVSLFDRAREGREGPWVTYARMELLRSPPELTGPALGFPSLTFRAWFEAQFGAPAWAALYRIPRTQWMDYLRWYRRMIDVKIDNETELTALDGCAEGVALTLRSAAGARRLAARRVVLATGRDGLGQAFVPPMFAALAQNLWSHSSADIDFDALAGKTVGVIGAGASAADNAAGALEHGAARVAMLVRRESLPRINKGLGIGSPGLWHGFYHLPLAQRQSIVAYIAQQAVPPPRASMLRCSRHRNFSLVTGCVIDDARAVNDRVVLSTSRGRLGFDYLILATGFAVDWPSRPELSALRAHIALHRDLAETGDDDGAGHGDDPVLDRGLAFKEREPGTAPWVTRVQCLAFPAFLSHGPITGDIPGITVGAERVASAIASGLFVEDYDRVFATLQAFDTPELTGQEFTIAEGISDFVDTGD